MNRQQATIAVVDDDPDVVIAAELLLKRHFSKIVCLNRPTDIPSLLKNESVDIFLLDMNFALGVNTGEEGLYWLDVILKQDKDAVVVLMTAYGDVEVSVRAIKCGAADFVLKPWQNEKLLATLNAALLLNQSRKQLKVIKQTQHHAIQNTDLIAEAANIQDMIKLARKAATTDVNVLVLGENGAGKEVLAKDIHLHSARAEELMLSVDLGAVPDNLFESELFGHVKGAFTDAHTERAGRFQAASGGTLFLDEIGNLPLHLQSKLLRVIENREITPLGSDKIIPVDVRLICATNMPIQQLVDEGRFRADLYYRINTVQLEIPPLRLRKNDIPLLLDFFVQKYASKYGLPVKTLSRAALDLLKHHSWPGNVRELAHSVERAMILSEGDDLEESDFFLSSSTQSNKPFFDDCNLERLEQEAVEYACKKHNGNISRAANELGITRTSLYRRLKKYQL